MHSAFLGEFLGTMIMILLGNGVVANVVLRQTKGEKSGWIVITTGWCFAVMAGVFTALAIGSDGHLNPAVTVGVAVSTGDWSRLSAYVPAQILGAMSGATLVWLSYLSHWEKTPDPLDKLACFSTIPAIRAPLANIVTEVIGTFVLVLVAAAISSKYGTGVGLSPGMGNRPVARRAHRLRDQPGARFRSPRHARHPPHPWQGCLGFWLRLRAHHRSLTGRDHCRCFGQVDRNLAATAR